MAKKGEYDFGDDLDLGFLDDLGGDAGFNGGEIKDDRKPVTRIAGSVKEGAVGKLKDRSFQRRMLKDTLPKGYGMAFDAADKGLGSLRDLYNTTAREIRPAVRDIARASRRMFPSKPNYVPAALWKKLEKLSEEGGGSGMSRGQQQENDITLALGQIFTEQAKQQAIKEERQEIDGVAEKLIKKKRFETTAEIMSSIQQGVSRLVGYQDSVAVAYQKKSLEISMRQYFTQKELLDRFIVHSDKAMAHFEAISKNTGLPEFVKLRDSEVALQMAREQFIGKITERPREYISGLIGRTAKNLGDKAKNKIIENVQAFQQVLSMSEGMEGMSKSGLAAEMVGGSIIDNLGARAARPIRRQMEKNDKVVMGGNMLQFLVENADSLANNYAGSDKYIKGLPKFLQDILKESMGGGYRRDDSLQGSMMGSLDKAAMFNVQTQKSITDIIPGWLGKIHAELKMVRTGKSDIAPEVFDFDSGRFVSQSQLSAKVYDKVFDQQGIDSAREELDELMRVINPEELSSKAKTVLKKTFLKKATDGIGFDPELYSKPEFYGDDVDMDVRAELAGHFRKLMGIGEDGKRTFTRENTAARVNISRQFNRLQDYIPDARGELLRYAQTGQLGNLSGISVLEQNDRGFTFNNDAYINALLGGAGPRPSAAGPSGGPTIGGGFPPPQPGGMGMGPFYPVGPRPSGPGVPESSTEQDRMQELFDSVAERVETAILEGSSKEENQMAVLWLEEIAGLLQEGGMQSGEATMGIRNRVKGLFGKAAGFGKGIWGKARGMGRRAKQRAGALLSGVMPLGRSALGGLMNTAKDLLGMGKDKAVDLYVKGKGKFPILTADGIRRGLYIDVNTGKVIKSMKDITGPVKNLDGDIILNAEDFAKGLYDKAGNILTRLIKRGMSFLEDARARGRKRIGQVLGGAKKLANFAFDVITRAKDIYVPGEGSPRLTVWGMRNGLYFDAETLDQIRKVTDIKGDVLDNEGNVILTAAEAAAGLVDSEGKPIKSLAQKAGDLLDKAMAVPGKVMGRLKKAGSWVKDRLSSAWDAISSGDGKFSIFGGGKDGELLSAVNRIYSLLETRLPEPQKFGRFDTDKDGDREGSYADIMQKRKAKKAAAAAGKGGKGRGKEGAQSEDGKSGGLLSMLGGLLSSGASGLGSVLSGAAGAMGLGKLKDMVFGGGAKAGKKGLLSRGLGLVKKVPFPTMGLLSGAASLAGSAMGAIGTAAGAIGTAVAGVGLAPLIIGGAAIAGAVYGGFKLYKHLTTDYSSLSRLRFIQYGIDFEDDDQLKIVTGLEDLMKTYVRITDKEVSIREVRRAELYEFMRSVDIDPTDEEERGYFIAWVRKRFQPVYAKYRKAVAQFNIGDLKKLDELDPAKKKKFIRSVGFGTGEESPLSYPLNYDGDDAEYDADDAKDAYDDAVEAINELPGVDAEEKKDSKAMAAAGAKKMAPEEKVEAAQEKRNKERDQKRDQKPMWQKIAETAAYATPMGAPVKAASWLYGKFRDTFYDDVKGEWVWPTMGRISSMFGPRIHPIHGTQKMHKGVDIAAPEGTPVRACGPGEIIRREFSKSYGNVIYIRHPDGKTSRYAHMSRFEDGYAVGSPVQAGAIIGYVGNTGQSAGNHLHFEIRKTDAWDADVIDPTKIIRTGEAREVAKQLKDEERAAKRGMDNDAAPEDVDETMEGLDTVASTATGDDAQTKRMQVDTARQKAGLNVGANPEIDQAVARGADIAKAGAREAMAQKKYQSEMSQQGMRSVQGILTQQLQTQRKMEQHLKKIADGITRVDKRTEQGEIQRQQMAEQRANSVNASTPTPKPAAPVKVSNSRSGGSF